MKTTTSAEWLTEPVQGGCTCSLSTGCGELDEAGCASCAHDPYEPCPFFGFMCGLPGDPACDCCTLEQQRNTMAFYTQADSAQGGDR